MNHAWAIAKKILLLCFHLCCSYNSCFRSRSTGWHKKRELLKNTTLIEEIQKKKIITEIEPLQLAF